MFATISDNSVCYQAITQIFINIQWEHVDCQRLQVWWEISLSTQGTRLGKSKQIGITIIVTINILTITQYHHPNHPLQRFECTVDMQCLVSYIQWFHTTPDNGTLLSWYICLKIWTWCLENQAIELYSSQFWATLLFYLLFFLIRHSTFAPDRVKCGQPLFFLRHLRFS